MRRKNTFKLFLLLTIMPLFALAGNGHSDTYSGKGDAIEHSWSTNEEQWEKAMVKSLKTNIADFRLFISYMSSQFMKDKRAFFKKGFQGQLNENSIAHFFTNLTKTYTPMYKKFIKAKTEFPNTVEEYTKQNNGPDNRPEATCNPSCTNLDFSSGNLSGWNAYYASNNSLTSSFSISPLTGGPAGAVTRAAFDASTNTDQVAIMSGTGVDPVAGAFIPLVAPISTYSCRVGDSTTALQGVAEVTNTFTVPSSGTALLTIQYAAVLENPLGHTYYEQPWFSMQVLDSKGNIIPGCGFDFVDSYDSGSNKVGWKAFYYAASGDTCYCKPWTSVFVPLGKYAGQCVTVVFETADCALGGHFGYAYVACSCTTLQLLTSSPAFCGQPTITITAPPGGTSYQWTGPCIASANNQQSVSVSCPGTYSVVVGSSAGPSCNDTLSITIPATTGTPPVPAFSTDTVCAGFPTTFTNFSNPISGTGVKFYWDFFNNGKYEDSTTSPTWTFTQGGVYLVTLHEIINGCGADTTIKVVVDSSSAPSFFAFSACAGQPSSFFVTGTTTSGFIWNFGDPASGANDTSTSSFPSHTYPNPGTYTVSLKTIGTHCPDSTTQVITVNASPTVSIITMPYKCGDSTLTFKDPDSTNIAEWDWELFNSSGVYMGAKFSVSSATVSYTFPAPGTYSIILYVFNSPSFCEARDSISVTIGPGVAPVAAFNAIPDSICLDKTAAFNDASTGGPSTWKWNFGDPASGIKNTSTSQNTTHIFSSVGTYTVTLNISGACGKDSTTRVVTVTTPVANFTGGNVCLHDSTHFLDASTALGGGTITKWSWNFGDGGTSLIQNPAHLYATAGTYNVTLTVTSSFGCDSAMKLQVNVVAPPSPAFTNSKACIGSTTQFTDKSTTTTGTVTGWSWKFGDGGTSLVQNPSHTYGAAGTYNVVLVVTNSTGCVDSIQQVVNVFPSPVIKFSADTLQGCAPLCVTFTDASTIVAPYKNNGWSWTFGDGGTATTQNPSYCYKAGGIYNVSLIVSSDSGCNATDTVKKMISVFSKPSAAFTYQPAMITIMEPLASFTSNSTSPGDSIVSYWWLFSEDGSTSTLQNPTYTYKDTGLYCTTLAVANSHGCTDTTVQCIDVQALYTFYIPNAFSPNGDGLNDVFGPKGDYIMTFEMYIFDRWGSPIFHTVNINKPWDGSINGNKAQEDTYVYVINITDVRKQKHSYIGKVTLTR